MSAWGRLLARVGLGSTPAGTDSSDARWVVIDVESTGLDPRRDRLVAIAGVAMHFVSGAPRVAVDDSFEVVVRQTSAGFDRANILVHGVGVGAQSRGVAPEEALEGFEHWAGPALRVGYHVDFDRVIIERAARMAGRAAVRARWLDLAPLAAATHPEVRAKALDDWLGHFGIPCLARHEAVADTLATAELLMRLWPALRRAGVTDAGRAQALARDQRWLLP